MKIKNIFTFIFSFLAAIVLMSFNSIAFAAIPTLSVISTGSGDSVRIIVNGDANATVIMSYTKTGSGLQLNSIGTTDSVGYFSTTVSTSTYGMASSSAVYVLVNGQQSSSVAWPYTTTSSSLTLSQTGVVLSIGQSSVVTAGSSSLYLSNNSNPSIANVNISGNSITFYANAYGSTVVTICSQGSTTNCGSIYVTVQTSGYTALTFSQTSVTIAAGQTVPISISGGNGTYSILSNSNPGVIQASINGSILNLSTLNNSGSSSITVCSSGQSYCGIVNVTIGTASYSTLAFSPSSPSVAIGQTATVSISGGSSSTYYLSSNSNTSYVQATVSGNTLSLYGIASGTSVITVCSSVGNCSSLSVTVNYVSAGGNITLSQSSLNLLVGQALTVTVSGGTAPYSLASYSSSIFQPSINGNVVTVTGVAAGTNTLAVCSAEGGCTNLTVIVNGSSSSSVVLSSSSLSLSVGQSSTVYITGSGSYYISNNSNSSIASTSISGNTITVSAITAGTTNVYVCQTSGPCVTLVVTVGGTSSSSSVVLSSSSLSLSAGQSSTVYITGSGSYYISNNSNSSIASTSISGNTITVSAITAGTTNVYVCQTSGSCTTLVVNVNSSSSSSTVSSTFLTANQNNPSLSLGQSKIITLSGGVNNYYYVTYNSNSSVVSTSVSGGNLTLNPIVNGAAIVVICSSNNACAPISVAVGVAANTDTTANNPIILSPNSVSIKSGEGAVVAVTGGSNYYISNNSNTSITSAAVVGSKVIVAGVGNGTSNIYICQTGGQCATLTVTVSPKSSSTTANSDNSTTYKHKFTKLMYLGFSDDEVLELQKKLSEEGYFDGSFTGYYGSVTQAAVIAYQKANGIRQTGNVGEATRAALNK